jgi:carboxypeptidase C (cathepsin A)
MKLSLAFLALSASVALGQETDEKSAFRQAVQAETAQASACNQVGDRDSCFATVDEDSSMPCSWCVAGAVPSECVTQDQAQQLPESVFECSTPGKSSFSFVEGTSHEFFGKDNDICDPSSKSLSGYMDIKGSDYDKNDENKHLFYWMFEKRGDFDEDTPFIVWLTGGPGCSSTLALLTENGPCKVAGDGSSTTVNPYSWTEAAHVLWLDQPAGVGFSYGAEDDSNEAMISEDAFYFLQAFFQTNPDYASSPLYIVGESYGT